MRIAVGHAHGLGEARVAVGHHNSGRNGSVAEGSVQAAEAQL